jgi:hypothetical protein
MCMNQIPLLHSKCMYSKLVQVSISHDVRLCTTKHVQIFILLMNALYLIITFFLILQMYKKYIYQSWFIFIFLWHCAGLSKIKFVIFNCNLKGTYNIPIIVQMSFLVGGVGVYVRLSSKLSITNSVIIQSIYYYLHTTPTLLGSVVAVAIELI